MRSRSLVTGALSALGLFAAMPAEATTSRFAELQVSSNMHAETLRERDEKIALLERSRPHTASTDKLPQPTSWRLNSAPVSPVRSPPRKPLLLSSSLIPDISRKFRNAQVVHEFRPLFRVT